MMAALGASCTAGECDDIARRAATWMVQIEHSGEAIKGRLRRPLRGFALDCPTAVLLAPASARWRPTSALQARHHAANVTRRHRSKERASSDAVRVVISSRDNYASVTCVREATGWGDLIVAQHWIKSAFVRSNSRIWNANEHVRAKRPNRGAKRLRTSLHERQCCYGSGAGQGRAGRLDGQ